MLVTKQYNAILAVDLSCVRHIGKSKVASRQDSFPQYTRSQVELADGTFGICRLTCESSCMDSVTISLSKAVSVAV